MLSGEIIRELRSRAQTVVPDDDEIGRDTLVFLAELVAAVVLSNNEIAQEVRALTDEVKAGITTM